MAQALPPAVQEALAAAGIADPELLDALATVLGSGVPQGLGPLAPLVERDPALVQRALQAALPRTDLHAQEKLLRAVLLGGEDLGALAFLEADMLAAPAERQAQPAWRNRRWSPCSWLLAAAQRTTQPQTRARIGRLAVQLLDEALAAPDRNARFNESQAFNQGGGFLDAAPLTRILALASPVGVVGLLACILKDASLPVRLRSFALVAYLRLGGQRPPQAGEIVAAMLAHEPESADDRLPELLRSGVIDRARLRAELPRPESAEWAQAIASLLVELAAPDPSEEIAVQLQALGAAVAQASLHALRVAARVLQALPLQQAHRDTVLASLRRALAGAEQAEDPGGYRRAVAGLMRDLGGLEPLAFGRIRWEAAGIADYLGAPASLDFLYSGFAPGTLVHTPAGRVPIEQLKAGDLVLSCAEDGRTIEPRRVARALVLADRELVRLKYYLANGAERSVDCSPDHPFWREDQGWTAVFRLGGVEEDARLRTLAGEHLEAGRSRSLPEHEQGEYDEEVVRFTTHDLEVEGTHSYFVGEDGVWVYDASTEGGFRREHAAARAQFEDMMQRRDAPVRDVPPPDARYGDGSLVKVGDRVLFTGTERRGKVHDFMYMDEILAWVAVDEGQPGQSTLVPVRGGRVQGLQKDARRGLRLL